MTTKKKLPDDVREKLRGYCAVSSTVTIRINEENLGEYAPTFVVNNLTIKDTHEISRAFQSSITKEPDIEFTEEILRRRLASIKKLWDEDAGEFIERDFEKGVGCDEELYAKIPFAMRMTIFAKMMNLNGLS